MRKFGKESISSEQTGDNRENSGNGWLKNHWCALALCAIVVVAFALRTVFAYGISADGGFALSGGSSAQYHLHIIESILDGSYSMTDAAVNYPNGGLNVHPPLMDYLGAGIASVLSAFGLSTTEAASAAIAILNPVVGALTCIPVYLVGRQMFDKKVGVVAALVFAFLALPISTTVFSSGTPYGLAAFFLTFMTYFVVKMVQAHDAEAGKSAVMVNSLLAGIFLLLSALTWNGFRFVVVLLAVAMIIQIIADRFAGKDFSGILGGYTVAILVGTLLSAVYYIPAGLFEAVFSGPLLIAVVSVVFAYIFLAVRAKPWIITVPALVIVFVVVCVIMAFAAPDLLNDFIFGNSIYASSIMEELASSHVSMSNVSAYYGWLTMWLPICYALYSTYVYLRKEHTATRLFITVWMFVMFFAVWTTSANAAVVGSVFAVGSAVVIVRIIQMANLGEWYASMRTAGFPGAFRKMIKPLPFASVVITALLIVVPNVSFAVDAGISNNSDADYYFSGNTQYTIKTGDAYPVGNLWDEFADQEKAGALATWMDYSYDAVTQGGFDSVTDTLGGGATAVSQMLLANGSGGATAAAMLRIMMADGSRNYASAFSGHSDVYDTVIGFINDPSSAEAVVDANPETYGAIRTDMAEENAVYLASIDAITTKMNEAEIMEAYNSVCRISGNSISYFMLDGSMLPLQYGDGGYFSTMAYFADYKVDNYGAATKFFSYNTYYGYTTYTSEIYSTFLWKAMIGPSATEAGYTSSYSYLVALSTSDGTVKAIPGYGLAGYEVAYWQLMYNPDSDATLSDDGWEYMDAYDAIAKQKTDGGLINYLSSIVLLQYTGVASGSDVLDGTVSVGGKAVNGATVSVYQYDETFGQYVMYSQTKTIDGNYSALVPSGDYRISVSLGDSEICSYRSGTIPQDISIAKTSVDGAVMVGDAVYDAEPMKLVLTGQAFVTGESKEVSVQIENGLIQIDEILPGAYSYVLYDSTGTSLGTGTVNIVSGSNDGFRITPTTRTITVTVNDQFGNSLQDGVVIATNTTTGAQFSAEVEDGKAVISAVSGVYTLSMGQGHTCIYSSTVNISSGNRTATISGGIYESNTVTLSGAPAGTIFTISAGTFSTLSYVIDGTTYFDVPVSVATDRMLYTVYGVSGGQVYHAVYTGGDRVSVTGSASSIIGGTLKNGDNGTSGTIRFVSSADEYYAASADSDGVYKAIIPNGTYTVYADNGNNMAYLGTMTVNGNADGKDISLVDGRRVSQTFKYDRGTSGSDANLPFVLGLLQITDYTLYSMTNTSGVVNFYIPDNVASTLSLNNKEGTLNNDAFDCKKLTRDIAEGTSNNTNTTAMTIKVYDADKEQDNVVKTQSVRIPYDMEVNFYEDDSDEVSNYKAGETVTLRPGSYTVTIAGTTGYYFDGTATLYPGETEFAGLENVQEVATVNVAKSESDMLTIESDGRYHTFNGGYYLEVGYEYFMKSVNTVNGKDTLAYGYLDLTDASAGETFSVNMTASQNEMEVTGNIGVDADGTITVIYNANGAQVKHDFDVTDGTYTLVLPESVTSVTAEVQVNTTIDTEKVYFEAEGTLSDLRNGVVRNISAITGDAPEDDDEEQPDFTAEIDSASFSDGVGSIRVKVTNNTGSVMTYALTAGSALSLASDYSKVIAGGATDYIDAAIFYDATRFAPGSDGFEVTIADINGAESEVLEITSGDDRSGSSDMGIYRMDDTGSKFGDRVSAYQYLYALTFDNRNVYSHNVTVSVPSVSGWAISIVDEDGKKIAESGEVFTIYGLQTTVLYVKVMLLSADADSTASVPSVTASVSVDGGSAQSFALSAKGASVTTDSMSASGTDVFNEKAGVPSGVWFLVVVIILLLVTVFWLASKRGVFSRRN